MTRVKPWFTTRQKKFERIFQNNGWRDPESRSGHASTLFQTRVIRRELPLLLKDLNIKTLLDIPCGDLNWIRETDIGKIRYIGADIVPAIIEMNKNHKYPDKTFLILDIVKDKLPRAELILCRDCLVHLPFKDIPKTVRNVKESGATYFLTTTFTKDRKNINIQTGRWRPLNLMLPPFNWPYPERIINEGFYDPDHKYDDKSLGLWKVEDLPVKLT